MPCVVCENWFCRKNILIYKTLLFNTITFKELLNIILNVKVIRLNMLLYIVLAKTRLMALYSGFWWANLFNGKSIIIVCLSLTWILGFLSYLICLNLMNLIHKGFEVLDFYKLRKAYWHILNVILYLEPMRSYQELLIYLLKLNTIKIKVRLIIIRIA